MVLNLGLTFLKTLDLFTSLHLMLLLLCFLKFFVSIHLPGYIPISKSLSFRTIISLSLIDVFSAVFVNSMNSLCMPLPTTTERKRSCNPEIWKGALKSARKVEKKYGKKNLKRMTDFEFGMLNGKLSAIRWVTGLDWDMLFD